MSFRRSISFERPLEDLTVPFSAFSRDILPRLGPLTTSIAASPFQSKGAWVHTSAPVSVVLPHSWLTVANPQRGSEKVKRKGSFLKKQLMHLLLFFLLGFGLGLAPFWRKDAMDAISSPLGSTLEKQNLVMEGSIFQESFRRQANTLTGSKMEHVVIEEGKSVTLGIEQVANIDTRSGEGSTLERTVSFGKNNTAKLFADLVPRKLLLVITPTYTRPFQALYLSRLAHTLKLVPPPLLWLVVEMRFQSMETAALLRDTGIMYRHLVGSKRISRAKERGAYLRNIALAHIDQHKLDGIVYFADDHYLHTLELFEQLRQIKRFGTWPVALLEHGKSRIAFQGPVCTGNTVIGWHTHERNKRSRRFHANLSGFGFNSTILWDSKTWKRPTMKPSQRLDREKYQETTLVQQLVEDESQMEGLPSGCSMVMVWHLNLESLENDYPTLWRLDKSLNTTISSI